MHQVYEAGQVIISWKGEFDSGAAQLVREQVLRHIKGLSVRVDLSRGRPVQDSALTILAELMRAFGSARLSLWGLGPPEQRSLRYMGVELPREMSRQARQDERETPSFRRSEEDEATNHPAFLTPPRAPAGLAALDAV